ncbi:MAG TPA: hypothetical protein V6C81_27140 [Planktothrix sp.]
MFPHHLIYPIYLAFGLAGGVLGGGLHILIVYCLEKPQSEGDLCTSIIGGLLGGIIAGTLFSMALNSEGTWDGTASFFTLMCAIVIGKATAVLCRTLVRQCVVGFRKLLGRSQPFAVHSNQERSGNFFRRAG